MATTPTTPSRAPSAVPVLMVVVIIIALVAWGVSRLGNASEEANAAKAEQKATAPAATSPPAARYAPVQTQNALVLMNECYTPCSAPIAWRFHIRTEGHPLDISFQGVAKPVRYPGEGDFAAPPEMRSGETKFESPDETRPHVRVQVYKVIAVPGGR